MKTEHIYKILCIMRYYTEEMSQLQITKTDIMKKLNVTYKTGSGVVNAFVRLGLLERKGKYYYITNTGKLLLNEMDIMYTFLNQLE